MRENEATRARGRGSSACACVREMCVSMRVRARAYVCVCLCVFACMCVCNRYYHVFSPPKNMPTLCRVVSAGVCARRVCCTCCPSGTLICQIRVFPRTPVSPTHQDEKQPEKKKSPGEARGPGGRGRGRGSKNRGGMPSAM